MEATDTFVSEVGARRVVPCPVCSGIETELYIEGDDNEMSVESVGSSRTLLSHGRVLRCRSCGLAYRSFRPNSNQLSRLYRVADDSTYRSGDAKPATDCRTTQTDHREACTGYWFGPGRRLCLGRVLAPDARIRMECVRCRAIGSTVQRATKVLGADASIQQCVLQEASLEGDFDLVTMWDVADHVPRPVEFLSLAASLLRPGGVVVLNVPRIDSAAARFMGQRWPVLLAEHLNYFTVPSLRICGGEAFLSLVHTGQRPAAFSLDYILFRASQHEHSVVSFEKAGSGHRNFSMVNSNLDWGSLCSVPKGSIVRERST